MGCGNVYPGGGVRAAVHSAMGACKRLSLGRANVCYGGLGRRFGHAQVCNFSLKFQNMVSDRHHCQQQSGRGAAGGFIPFRGVIIRAGFCFALKLYEGCRLLLKTSCRVGQISMSRLAKRVNVLAARNILCAFCTDCVFFCVGAGSMIKSLWPLLHAKGTLPIESSA